MVSVGNITRSADKRNNVGREIPVTANNQPAVALLIAGGLIPRCRGVSTLRVHVL